MAIFESILYICLSGSLVLWIALELVTTGFLYMQTKTLFLDISEFIDHPWVKGSIFGE